MEGIKYFNFTWGLLVDVNTENLGQYECKGTNDNGHIFYSYSNLTAYCNVH